MLAVDQRLIDSRRVYAEAVDASALRALHDATRVVIERENGDDGHYMPPRSNPFQKLILRIHEQVVPVGVRMNVQESALSEEPSSGTPRETDVQVIMESERGTERIAIECRDHVRPQDVSWIDALIGKYIDLGFDNVIAVSSSGFSSAAIAKGAKFKIECRTLEEALDTAWPTEFAKMGISTVEHRLTDLLFGIKCEPRLEAGNENEDMIIASDGSQHGRGRHEVARNRGPSALPE